MQDSYHQFGLRYGPILESLTSLLQRRYNPPSKPGPYGKSAGLMHGPTTEDRNCASKPVAPRSLALFKNTDMNASPIWARLCLLLGGPGAAITRAMNRAAMIIIQVRALIRLLVTAPGPPNTNFASCVFVCSSDVMVLGNHSDHGEFWIKKSWKMLAIPDLGMNCVLTPPRPRELLLLFGRFCTVR